MASAKDIISRALNACGGVFRPSMDEDKTFGKKTKFNVTPNGSDEVVYSFRVKIDKKKYQSITNPGEGAGAEGGKASNQNASAQDEAIALDANQAVQQAMRECAATIEQCRARNKIACPYHGAKIIEMDIMQRLQNLGVNAVPKVEADKDRRGRPTGTYMIQIPCMDVWSERDKVERAINEFMQTPGVAPEEGRDAENDWTDDIHELEEGGSPAESGYTSFFEVDRLDPNATSEAEAHVDEPVDEEEDDEEDGEENETTETERNEEATPPVQEEPTTASGRPGNETAESGEENAPRTENGNHAASGANQEVVDYLRGQLENENLPQSVRDFLQNQLDALTPHEEEEAIESEPQADVNSEVEEDTEPVELGDVEAAFADTPELRTEEAIELGRTVGRAMSETGVTNANNAHEVRQGNADIHDALTRLARHWGEGNRDRIFRGINDALNGTPNRDVDTYLDEAEGVLGADHPVMRAIRSRVAENAPQAQSPTEQQINDAARQHAEYLNRTQNRTGDSRMTPDTVGWYIRDMINGGMPYDGRNLASSLSGLDLDDPVLNHLRNRLSESEQNNFDSEYNSLRSDVNGRAEEGGAQAQTRGQEIAANAETPQQNADARESRVLHRIDDDQMNDDIAPDVMNALHGELRRAGRRKAELFAEAGRDTRSPAYAAGKRFSSYERALNTILSGLPSTYRDLLTDTEAYVSREADSEESRRRPDGTTEAVRGFNPETGAQTTPHKRAMDAARFVAHLIGQHVEMDANGRANFMPGVENETLPPLTFETSSSHAAHRQAMQAAANANAQTTPPRPQPTRREFFAAPTGTEGRIDVGSDRANSIRTNAQNAANSAQSSRVRNILSRIARPQQQPEERLD